jgi:hypothetical protein
MALPQAVARKAERAAELMKQQQPATPAQPAADAKLKEQLDRQARELAEVTQKYRSLQGSHKEQLELQGKIKQLTSDNEALQAKVDERPSATDLTEDERRLAGDDMVKIMQKVAANTVESTVKKHLKPLGERFDQFQRMNEAQYWAIVDYYVPDFRAQNDDPKFVAWLKEIDSETSQLRDDLLQRAHAAMMGYRVAEIFRAYKESREIGARQTDNPNPANMPDINPGPGSGQPPQIPDSSGQRQWTRAEIKQFYDSKRNRRGPLSKAELEEARKIELDISNAVKEHRVVG